MHVVRVATDRMGANPIGQVCQGRKAKVLLWCPKGTTNEIADTADYHVGMMMASGFANEPKFLFNFLRKQNQKPGTYYILLWNITRSNSDAVFEVDFEG